MIDRWGCRPASSNVEDVPSPRRSPLAGLGVARSSWPRLVTACSCRGQRHAARLGAPVSGTPHALAPIALHDCTAQLLGLRRAGAGRSEGHGALRLRHAVACRWTTAARTAARSRSRSSGSTPRRTPRRRCSRCWSTRAARAAGGLDFGLGLLGAALPRCHAATSTSSLSTRVASASPRPVHCLTDAQKDALPGRVAGPADTRAGILRRGAARPTVLARLCASKSGRACSYYNTVSTARDMDQLRQAVGDDVMNYLGFSYGTELGWTYAHLFPAQVHTFVLDGAVDPDADAPTRTRPGRCRVSRVPSASSPRGAGMRQPVLDAARPDRGSRAPVRRDAALATRRPSTSRRLTGIAGQHRRHGGAVLAKRLAAAGPALTAATARRRHRTVGTRRPLQPAPGRRLVRQHHRRQHRHQLQRLAGSQATADRARSCCRAQSLARRFPIFGSSAGGGPGCLGWQPHRTPVPPVDRDTAKPVLVVGNLHDPATPYQGAQHLAGEIGNAGLLTWNGEGHTSYLSGSSCVDDYVNAYLLHGTMPPATTRCVPR